MSAKYDALVIDLDGTLLGPDGRVSERNRRAVRDARAAGLDVIIATGRALIESRSSLESIEHTGVVVAAGGAMLIDSVGGRTIHRHVIPQNLVTQAANVLIRHGHKVLILKDGHVATYDYFTVGAAPLDPASEWWFSTLSVRVRNGMHMEEDEHPHDSVRVAVVAQGEALADIVATLREAMGQRVDLQRWSAVTATESTGSRTHLLEVFAPGVNKWSMIEHHCAANGISTDRVAAIGDEINDEQMICNAGLGVAMGNAVPSVRGAAKKVTAGHDADGLAIAVEHILAGRW